MTRLQITHAILSGMLFMSLLTACSLPAPRPTDPKTLGEQLLISQAIQRSLEEATAGIPKGSSIILDTSGLTPDQTFLGDIVAGWLGSQGLLIRMTEEHATFRVRVLTQSIGTRRGVRFLGNPKFQSVWIPFPFPELAIWKRDREQGYVRFYLDVFETGSDRFVRSTAPYIGSVVETKYTLFFFLKWKKTDLSESLDVF